MKNLRKFLLVVLLLPSTGAFAAGGMIGGGDDIGKDYICHSSPNIDDFYVIHIQNAGLGNLYQVTIENGAGDISLPVDAQLSVSTGGPEGQVNSFNGHEISLRIFMDQPARFPQFYPKAKRATVDFAFFPEGRVLHNSEVDCEMQ